MNKVNECEGCSSNYITTRCIALTLSGCPCSHCLIKMMCEQPCNDLRKHLSVARDYIEKNNS